MGNLRGVTILLLDPVVASALGSVRLADHNMAAHNRPLAATYMAKQFCLSVCATTWRLNKKILGVVIFDQYSYLINLSGTLCR